MILGLAAPEQPTFDELERQRREAKAAELLKLPDIPPLAQAIFPAAVVGLVDRQKHPIVWWVFGVFPLAGAGAAMIIKRRVW